MRKEVVNSTGRQAGGTGVVSMLTRWIGQRSLSMSNVINTFAGGYVNRKSWLRQSEEEIRKAFVSESARFILLQNLNPVVHLSAPDSNAAPKHALTFLQWSHLDQYLGREAQTVFESENDKLGPVTAEAQDDRVRGLSSDLFPLFG